MRVLATRRHPEGGAPNVDQILPLEQLENLLAQVGFVVLAVPLTGETRGMIGEAKLHRVNSAPAAGSCARS